ncbi:hypothetical protein D3C76_1215200 [compost metagenome]
MPGIEDQSKGCNIMTRVCTEVQLLCQPTVRVLTTVWNSDLYDGIRIISQDESYCHRRSICGRWLVEADRQLGVAIDLQLCFVQTQEVLRIQIAVHHQ